MVTHYRTARRSFLFASHQFYRGWRRLLLAANLLLFLISSVALAQSNQDSSKAKLNLNGKWGYVVVNGQPDMVAHFIVQKTADDFKLILINPGGVADGQVIHQGRFINPTTVDGKSLLPEGPGGALIWINEQVIVQDADHLVFTHKNTMVYRVSPISPDDPPCSSEAGQEVTGDYAYLRGQAAISQQGNSGTAECWFRRGASKGDVSSQRVLDSMSQASQAPPEQAMRSGPAVANASFEEPDIGPCPNLRGLFGYSDGWTFTRAGITAAGCRIKYVSPQPLPGAGHQMAWIQSAGEFSEISQTIRGFLPGHTYAVTFLSAGRPYAPDCARPCTELSFSVYAGETNILDVDSPPTERFQRYETNSFAASGSEIIRFRGTAPPGNEQSTYIDMVAIEDQGICSADTSSSVGADKAFFRGNALFRAKDYVAANCWFSASAAKGNANAEGLLAFAYYRGTEGVRQNYAQAFSWAQKSALQNNYIGSECLYLLYSNGWGVPKDPDKANEWHQRALLKKQLEDAQIQRDLAQREALNAKINAQQIRSGEQFRAAQIQGNQDAVAAGLFGFVLGAMAADSPIGISPQVNLNIEVQQMGGHPPQ